MKRLLVGLLVILLPACGGGQPPTAGAAGALVGTVMLGPMADATVSAYATDGSGTLLATTSSDSQGGFDMPLQAPSGIIELRVTGGHYAEESSGATVRLAPGQSLLALVPYEAGRERFAAITPLTHIAAGLALFHMQRGAPVADAATQANAEVSTVFGFDVLATRPLDITDVQNADSRLSPGLKYGFVIAAISQWTYEQGGNAAAQAGLPYQPGAAPFNSIAFTQALYDDVNADGVLDGVGSGGPITPLHLGPISLGTGTYRHDLALALVRAAFTRGLSASGVPTGNYSTLPGAMLVPFAAAINDSGDALFHGAAQTPLDEGGLRLIPDALMPPGVSGWVRGTITLSGTVADAFGPGLPVVFVRIDGGSPWPVAVEPVSPGAHHGHFSVPIDTRAYSDGTHQITETVADLVGASQTVSEAPGFDNTAPAGCALTLVIGVGTSGRFSGRWTDGSGSGVVAASLNGVPATVGPGTWSADGPTVMATVPAFNPYTMVLPVIVTLVDAAGNSNSFNLFSEPQWSSGQSNPALCPP